MSFSRKTFTNIFGEINPEFNIYTLEDIASEEKRSIISGPFGSNISSKYFTESGVPVIRGNNLTEDNTRFIDNGFVFVSYEKADELNTYAKVDDLIFTAAGTIGQVGMIPENSKFEEYVISNKQLRVTLDLDKVNQHYVYYWFSSKLINKYIKQLNTGSTIPLINLSIIKGLPIPLPSKKIQDKIATIILNIDKKIQLNKEINKNLEQYLFYIFNENFMEFDFNEFSNSRKQIPISWKLGNFNDIIDSLGSGDWGKEECTGNYTSEVYCIRGADIPDVKQGNKGKMPIRFILPKNFKNKKLTKNSIVIEISGGSPTQSTGRTVYITEDFLNRFDKDMICTNFCKVINPKKDYEIFLYLYLNYLYDKDVMFAYENGTTGIKNFDIKSFINNFLIVIPSSEDIIKFNNLVKDVFDIIMHNGLEIEKLQQLRDTLLPKLMSGEIDVSKINCDFILWLYLYLICCDKFK